MSRIIATLDAETDPFKFGRVPKPFVFGLYWFDGPIERFATFGTVEELVAYVRPRNFLIYAHNGGKFDFLFMLDYLDSGSRLKLIAGRLGEFNLGNSLMRDSWLIFPMALSTYKKDEIDYEKFESPVRAQHWDEIISYLRGDCKYLYELVSSFRHNYGNKLTLAGAAMAFWQANFNVKAPRSNPAFYNAFELYYGGGRVECFQKGVFELPIKSYDINSAYPFAMCSPHPWGFNYETRSTAPDSNWHLCFFRIEGKAKGYFLHKSKRGNSYPNSGEFLEFYTTGHELQAALEFDPDYEFKLISCHQFKEAMKFDGYVYHFFRLKAASIKGSSDYLFAKLMMNSLYGKFGANPAEYRDYMIVPPDEVPYWEASTEFKLADIIAPWALMHKPLDESAQYFYNVATAASITGFVRAYGLTALVKSFGLDFWRNPDLFYFDTDGCQCRSDTMNVEMGKVLGQWDTDFVARRAGYGGPKLYVLENETETKYACKGVRLLPDQIFKIARGEEILWQNPAPTMSVKGEIRFIERRVKRQ